MVTPRSSKARRCRGVGSVSFSKVTPPWAGRRMVLRVRVERCVSSVWKLWQSAPSAVCCVRAFCSAESPRRAFATASSRGAFFSSSAKVSGAHAFLCLLAEHLVFHLRAAWAPLTFADEEKNAPREDAVAKAQRGDSAEQKARTQKTADGALCHGFHSLLTHLATLTRN